MLVPLTFACLTAAAAEFGFAAIDLQTILTVEGGRVGVCNRNSNGSADCGPFQLNTVNAGALATVFGLPETVAMRLVRDDGCANARGAAFLLRQRIHEAGDAWTGAGNYHSRTPALRRAYQARLLAAYQRLRGRATAPARGIPARGVGLSARTTQAEGAPTPRRSRGGPGDRLLAVLP